MTDLTIPGMPLYWRLPTTRQDPHPAIPTQMNFSFAYDPTHVLLQQADTVEMALARDAIYREPENVGYLRPGGQSFGYLAPFNKFLDDISVCRSTTPTALDVGCGAGALVGLLLTLGIDAYGWDPAPQMSPPAIADRISTGAIGPRMGYYDLITHHHVLEHADDPVAFLRDWASRLTPRGIMAFAVPDCTWSTVNCDISMALHEHVSYFTEVALCHVCAAAGLMPTRIERASYGGSIYVAARRQRDVAVPNSIGFHFDRFIEGCYRNIGAFNIILERAKRIGRVGMWCPLRAIPYLTATSNLHGMTLWDDALAGGYIDGLAEPVRGPKDLRKERPDTMFVMSETFGHTIAGMLRTAYPNMRIVTLAEIAQPWKP